MKFILKRASQPLFVAEGGTEPPVDFPGVEKEKMTRWESWGVSDFQKLSPEMQQRWTSQGWKHKISTGTRNCLMRIGQDFVWTVKLPTLEQLMILRERSGSDLIIEYSEEFQLPQITIYDDYLE